MVLPSTGISSRSRITTFAWLYCILVGGESNPFRVIRFSALLWSLLLWAWMNLIDHNVITALSWHRDKTILSCSALVEVFNYFFRCTSLLHTCIKITRDFLAIPPNPPLSIPLSILSASVTSSCPLAIIWGFTRVISDHRH